MSNKENRGNKESKLHGKEMDLMYIETMYIET